MLQYLPDPDYLLLRHLVLPHLPEARQTASKKAIDGIEDKLRRPVNAPNGLLPTPPTLATALAAAGSYAPARVHVPPTAPPTESGTPNSVATPSPMHPPAAMMHKGSWDEEMARQQRAPRAPPSPPLASTAGADKWQNGSLA